MPGVLTSEMPWLKREPGARHDEARIAVRDRDGDAGRDERPLAGAELDGFARDEVEPGVTRVGALGQHRVVAEPRDLEVDHDELIAAVLASATR